MADDTELKNINKEFAKYIREIPREDTSVEGIDKLKGELRAILRKYQDLVAPD